MHRIFLCLVCWMFSLAARADLNVFACEPEWAALVNEIGGGHVDVYSATTALQDPHYIQARPSLIAKIRSAGLVVCSGAQLEIGWLPALLSKGNNGAVQPGTPGFLEVSKLVRRLEIPASVDRAQGDMHPEGNPHVQTNPHNIGLIAPVLAARMAQLDPANAAAYKDALTDFTRRWDEAVAGWDARGTPLKGKRIIPHHKSWAYLEDWLGLQELGNLEPLPGVPPTAAHLSDLLARFGEGGADFIVRTSFQDEKASLWLSERSGIPALVLPLSPGGTEHATDLFRMFDDILDRLLGAKS
ncbi:MAG: zinc ABC transporter substrate-binding protein [Gammaproteobacteria bacterium]|nr:zinc ABC transporter substrate-binding protein [Gammaproteobacteria bacterium]